MRRYRKEPEGWYWHQNNDVFDGPFSSRKAAKNSFAEHYRKTAVPRLVIRMGGGVNEFEQNCPKNNP